MRLTKSDISQVQCKYNKSVVDKIRIRSLAHHNVHSIAPKSNESKLCNYFVAAAAI